jgi:signal transduction histidine kinase
VSNNIGCVIEDGAGFLWIGSNAGLMRVAKKSLAELAVGGRALLNVRSFGRPDGLPTRECTLGSQPGAARGRDGRLWFPTTKGLVSVDPSKILKNTNPPPVSIESVLVDGDEQGLGAIRARLPATLTLTPRREHLEIAFTSLNLSSPERARFRYRLEGHEKEWVEAGDSRVVHYSKLPPGEYRFQVIASNEDGVWNERGMSLAIIVEPPFWRTWWFLGVVFASVIGMVAGVVHYVSTQKLQRQLADLRQQEALEKERSRIARDIHDQLGANLTQVSLLGELIEGDKEQPAEVSAHAKQIQATALETSRALDQIVWTVNPENDTLDGLVNYVCKYAQEYLAVAGLRYRLEVPADLPNTPITPEIRHNIFLAAKEAITNVVRHAQASSAWVRLKLEPDRFTIEIQDDGKGPAGMSEKRAQSRNGLRNMGRRLEDVGGKFEIGPAPERGTLVRLVAPLGKH